MNVLAGAMCLHWILDFVGSKSFMPSVSGNNFDLDILLCSHNLLSEVPTAIKTLYHGQSLIINSQI